MRREQSPDLKDVDKVRGDDGCCPDVVRAWAPSGPPLSLRAPTTPPVFSPGCAKARTWASWGTWFRGSFPHGGSPTANQGHGSRLARPQGEFPEPAPITHELIIVIGSSLDKMSHLTYIHTCICLVRTTFPSSQCGVVPEWFGPGSQGHGMKDLRLSSQEYSSATPLSSTVNAPMPHHFSYSSFSRDLKPSHEGHWCHCQNHKEPLDDGIVEMVD